MHKDFHIAYNKFGKVVVSVTLFFSSIIASAQPPDSHISYHTDYDSEPIRIENLVSHLKAFQEHADQNQGDFPGTRFTLSSGYSASRDYIMKKLQEAGYRVSAQDVPFNISYITSPAIFEQLSPLKKAYVENEDYTPFTSSGEADLTATVSLPSGDKSGCKEEDFAGFSAESIALIQRGGNCTSVDKVVHAVQAGAKGVIIYNTEPGVLFVSLGATVPYDKTPVVFVSSRVGDAFISDMEKGLSPTIHFDFHMVKKSGFSQNIIAESIDGDPNHIVMAGAHLDSSWGNAGINDNGSAAAAILETAIQFKNTKPVNKLRFTWWTGEEVGLIGSQYYVDHLSKEEKAKIAVYLNYEILGAPNGARLIMGANDDISPPGSEKITQLYVDYFNTQGLKSLVIDPSIANASARSDMQAFMKAGIPSGFIVTGAELPWNIILQSVFTDLPNRKLGVATHPCYHKLCDKLMLENSSLKDPNFDFDLYLQMSKAAAFVIASYAMDDIT